jgi:hypothetical protein
MQAWFDLRRAHERADELRAEAASERLAREGGRAGRFGLRRRFARALFASAQLLASAGRRVDAAVAR